jgi:hypothetical protein
MKHPIKLVPDVPVELRPNQPFLRGQHGGVIGIAGARGIKKADGAFHVFHSYFLVSFFNSKKGTEYFELNTINLLAKKLHGIVISKQKIGTIYLLMFSKL